MIGTIRLNGVSLYHILGNSQALYIATMLLNIHDIPFKALLKSYHDEPPLNRRFTLSDMITAIRDAIFSLCCPRSK